MVSRQETARPLLTPGEVMQLPPSNELVLVSSVHPILARKARYYEDRRLQERILAPPSFVNLVKESPKAHRDDWSALAPVVVDPKPATCGSSDEDPDNAGIRREPALPERSGGIARRPPSEGGLSP